MSFTAKKTSGKAFARVNRSSLWYKFKNKFKKKTKPAVKLPTRKVATPPLSRKFNLFKRIDPRIIRIALASFVFALLAAAIYGLIAAVRSPYFALSEITIIGNNSIAADKIQAEVKSFEGQSLFLIPSDKVKQKIFTAYPNLYSIHISKLYPNKLSIVVSETEPKMILINLNGAYLIDEDAKVIEVLSQEKINYADDRLEIAVGLADESSPLVKNIFLEKFKTANNLSGMSEEKQQAFIASDFHYESIPQKDKFAEYQKLRTDILNEINALTGNIFNKIKINDYGFLPQIIYIDNTQFAKNDIIDKKRLELTLAIDKFFGAPNSTVHIVGRVEWQSQLLVSVNLSNGVKVIFGALKQPISQLEDYETMSSYLKNKNKRFSQIDLSSSKISVK